MDLTRWQPMQEMMTLRDTVNRLFDQSLFQALPHFDNNMVRMDLLERENELLVRAPVPGFKAEQIDISLQGNTLTLSGEMEEESDKKEENYHLHEWHQGSFQRMVRLPINVNTDKVTAECRDGILTVHLPKAEVKGLKKIAIQNGH